MSIEVLYEDGYGKSIVTDGRYIKAIGGDGTLLYAINHFNHLGLPFFGVASGTVNFLMNRDIEPDIVHTSVKFNRLKVTVIRLVDGEPESSEYFAFNDVVIGQFNAWIDFQCIHKDDQIGSFFGSGMIVSTAAGSTGINRNNGGTILPLTSDQWSVTGMQTNRRIDSVINPNILHIVASRRSGSISIGIDGSMYTVDGISEVLIEQGDVVDVRFNSFAEFQKKRQ
jgi:NAD kinase